MKFVRFVIVFVVVVFVFFLVVIGIVAIVGGTVSRLALFLAFACELIRYSLVCLGIVCLV